ncbi:PTS sugar transporter subunit IIC [uncultured Enorma sp.]|uniref:PTS mannose/fructose/sorbose/N-acetylgalactosamine transporter subunit IIC n=1 Tax=uncultured Enorma sp. TaxID=1714346 RepID=UPI002805D6AB|nr:PTS sugar transporter subunit IIC [uncultured Enorma sp.]
MESAILDAAFIAFVYFLVNVDCPLLMMCQAPLFLGGFFGAVYGDLTTGIMLGAALEAIYLSAVAVGANMPSDQALAACISIPIALKTGMDINTAVTLAVPFGILGAFMDNFRRTVNAMWWHRAQKHIDELNFRALNFDAVVGPTLVQFIIRFIPVFIVSYLGADAATSLIAAMPEWLNHGLSVVGGILPALGFTMAISIIGGRELLPFFVLGFFITQFAHLPMLLMAVIAAALAMLHMTYTRSGQPALAMADDDEDDD